MDINLFQNTKQLYIENDATENQWLDFYEILFKELAKIKPDDLIFEHTSFMKDCEDFFASNDKFEKADILNQLRNAAFNIFEARKRIQNIMKKYGKI